MQVIKRRQFPRAYNISVLALLSEYGAHGTSKCFYFIFWLQFILSHWKGNIVGRCSNNSYTMMTRYRPTPL